MTDFLSIIWGAFDAVYDWLILAFSTYGMDFDSIIIGMLCVTLIIGYVLSPYLHNPLPSASSIRDKKERDEKRSSRSKSK